MTGRRGEGCEVPACAGTPHVGLTPHTTTDESGGPGSPLSNSPPQTVERTFEAMTEGGNGGTAEGGIAGVNDEAPAIERGPLEFAWKRLD